MLALLSTRPGGPDTLALETLSDPCPKRGEVLLSVKACGVNYPDALIIEDRYQFKPERPFAPGGEVSGTVEALGEGVTSLRVGDRVIASPTSTSLVPGWWWREADRLPVPCLRAVAPSRPSGASWRPSP